MIGTNSSIFLRNVLPPFSGEKSRPYTGLHDVASQRIVHFIITAITKTTIE
jgi:hypothetical protein